MKLVLIDRDGVINCDLERSVRSIEEFKLMTSSAHAIRDLNRAGFKVVVITNQAGVGRGDITEAKLHEIHDYMHAELRKYDAYVDEVIYCGDAVNSLRRKPAPGMLFEALEKYQAIPAETPFVGDALRDLQAAEAARCIPILVRSGKGEETLKAGLPDSLKDVEIFNNLNAFVKAWLPSLDLK